MVPFAVAFLIAGGILFIVKREQVTWVQKSAIGGRMPSGCAVAEGIAIILFALLLAWLYWTGWW